MTPLLRRMAHLFRRDRFEADLKDELRFHEEMAAEDARHGGADPEEARFAARRRVGNAAQVGENAREVWTPPALEQLLQDVHYALRGLRRRPGYAVAGILTLVLGIGASTALVSVLNAVLLRPLPYADPDRLVQVWEHNIPRDVRENIVSPANFIDWRDRSRSFSSLATYTWSNLSLAGDEPEQISGRTVSTNLFSVLGAAPLRGRLFVPDDTVPGAPRALVISYGLWTRRFGQDPAAVGKVLALREGQATVVGVMPRSFRPLGDEEYWEPWPLTSDLRIRRGRYAMVIGRLAPGADARGADAELKGIAQTLAAENTRFNTGWTVDVIPLQQQVTGKARPVLLLLAGAIAAVLLIACANVANLKLGQVLARRTEIAVRAALGASRRRILQQMVVEGLVLAAIGGGLGILAAMLLVRAMVNGKMRQIPRLAEVSVDFRVLAVALAVTALVGVVFGLAPAFALREKALRQPLSKRGGDGGAGGAAQRLRGFLVSAQVALSLMLLAGAGLATRSLMKLQAVDPGFVPDQVLTFELDLSGDQYSKPEQRALFYDGLLERVRAQTGVMDAGIVNFLPPRTLAPGTGYVVIGQPPPPAGQEPATDLNIVDPGYFSTMKIPLEQGRNFTASDDRNAPRVVIVSKALARASWGKENPIGRRLRVAWLEADSLLEVVGVVADVRRAGLDTEPRAAVYYPFGQSPSGYMTLVMRTRGDPRALVGTVKSQIAALDRSLPVLGIQTMKERLRDSVSDRRYPMLLLVVLAGLALVLAAIGLYGVLAYLVGQRTREIGVRRALGATGAGIARLVLGEGFRFVGLGIAAGMAASLATTRFLGRLLYGLSPTDPVTLLLVAGVLIGVAALATWLPTRRALRVDPAVTLREEG